MTFDNDEVQAIRERELRDFLFEGLLQFGDGLRCINGSINMGFSPSGGYWK